MPYVWIFKQPWVTNAIAYIVQEKVRVQLKCFKTQQKPKDSIAVYFSKFKQLRKWKTNTIQKYHELLQRSKENLDSAIST